MANNNHFKLEILPGERIIKRAEHHWTAWGVSLISSLVIGFLLIFLPLIDLPQPPFLFWGWLGLVILAIWDIISLNNDKMIITNLRVLKKQGG